MVKTILIAVDGSKYSATALDAAIWLSKSLQADLHVFSVADIRMLQGPWLADLSGVAGVQPFESFLPQIQQLNEQKAQIIVDAACEKAKELKCRKEIRSGSVVDAILDLERGAELVILGQKGEGHEATGEWLGSVTDRVIRKSIKPCLIVPSKFEPIQSILAAYDGSNHANHALYAAFDLVESLKAKLSILTVNEPHHEANKSWALKEALELAYKRGLQATPISVEGDAENQILKVADEQHHNLIVMGAYGHTRIRELILGSVTQHVVRKSQIPVLLAR